MNKSGYLKSGYKKRTMINNFLSRLKFVELHAYGYHIPIIWIYDNHVALLTFFIKSACTLDKE